MEDKEDNKSSVSIMTNVFSNNPVSPSAKEKQVDSYLLRKEKQDLLRKETEAAFAEQERLADEEVERLMARGISF